VNIEQRCDPSGSETRYGSQYGKVCGVDHIFAKGARCSSANEINRDECDPKNLNRRDAGAATDTSKDLDCWVHPEWSGKASELPLSAVRLSTVGDGSGSYTAIIGWSVFTGYLITLAGLWCHLVFSSRIYRPLPRKERKICQTRIAPECYDERLSPFITQAEFIEFVQRIRASRRTNGWLLFGAWLLVLAIGVGTLVWAGGDEIRSHLGEWAPPLFVGLAASLLFCNCWVPEPLHRYLFEKGVENMTAVWECKGVVVHPVEHVYSVTEGRETRQESRTELAFFSK
jgi:hypothetical protein